MTMHTSPTVAATDLSVERIASTAGVSIQTVYAHFGSKRALLMATIDEVQRDAGLYRDLERVWTSPDGETALRRMSEATFALWDRAWPVVSFTLAARRTDPEIRAQMEMVDSYRRANLKSIVERLAAEGRLRIGLGAAAATDLAFAFTTSGVYEVLVRARRWSLRRATERVTDATIAAILDPDRMSQLEGPADWSSVMRPPPPNPDLSDARSRG
jgi:AcrR family transcriptional regulator